MFGVEDGNVVVVALHVHYGLSDCKVHRDLFVAFDWLVCTCSGFFTFLSACGVFGWGIARRGAFIKWESYNSRFPTSGGAGEKELYDFLQRLEGRFDICRNEGEARLLSKLRNHPKLDILARVQSELPGLPPDDICLLTDASHPSLASNTNFGIQELLRHLSEHEEASISVYDYSIQDPAERTRQTTVSELLSSFQPGSTRSTALNFLGIENRTKIQFCPSPITLGVALSKLDARRYHDKGKTESTWRAEPPKEFFLASMRNSISTIHVDIGAAVTWVLILEGRKIWYFPRHVSSQTVRWLAKAGSQTPENYGGWAKVELRRGDLLWVQKKKGSLQSPTSTLG